MVNPGPIGHDIRPEDVVVLCGSTRGPKGLRNYCIIWGLRLRLYEAELEVNKG